MLYCIVFIFGTNRLLSSPIQRHVLRLRKKLSAPPSKVGDDDDLTRIASRNKRYVLYCTVRYYRMQSIHPEASSVYICFVSFTLHLLTNHILHYLTYYILSITQLPSLSITIQSDCNSVRNGLWAHLLLHLPLDRSRPTPGTQLSHLSRTDSVLSTRTMM